MIGVARVDRALCKSLDINSCTAMFRLRRVAAVVEVLSSERQYLLKESGEWRQNEIQIDYDNLLKNFRSNTHGF